MGQSLSGAVILIPHNSGPVNEGEERVLRHLEQHLPYSVFLIPNVAIPYKFPQTAEEYDCIVVTPDAAFVLEVKDLAPRVEVAKQNMFVGGDPRANPLITTRIKAQKLKTRLVSKLPSIGKDIRVENIVVLSRDPMSLTVCDAMKDRVVGSTVAGWLGCRICDSTKCGNG